MALESLLVILLIGAVAGWLAGLIVKGYGYGLLGNIVVGIVGAFVAGLILPRVGLSIGSGIAGSIIHATIGAVILLFLIRLVKRAWIFQSNAGPQVQRPDKTFAVPQRFSLNREAVRTDHNQIAGARIGQV
ncbi:MAG: GlsB/YeaQ/YmgE family stress response membrane protein [Albidovulum sp.]